MSLTYGEMRTTEEKLYDEKVLAKVKNGIALLEKKHGPDFVDHINLDTLDLRQGDKCVLGQLYNGNPSFATGYSWAVCEFRELGTPEGRDAHGFSIFGDGLPWCDDDRESYENRWDALQQAWVDVLTPRVKRNG